MTYYPAYERFSRPATLVSGEGYARDALYDAIYSMGAIAAMMRALLAEGEDQRHLSEHVYHLMDQQRCLLAGIFEELGVEAARRDAAAGTIPQTSVPTEALAEPAHKLRLQFIESNAKAGIDAGLIGSALNLSEADVERVIARLRGAGGAATAAQGGKASGALRRASLQA